MDDPYTPPGAPLAQGPDAPLAGDRLRKFVAAFVCALATQVVGLLAVAYGVGSRAEHIRWGMLLPMLVVVAAITATACSLVPLRRIILTTLLSIPVVILVFLGLGSTLDAFGLI